MKKEDTLQDRKKRAKSLGREKIKIGFSGMNRLENHYFNDLLKNTMKQISDANLEFKTQNLMDKIKENGSLYGK
jgi:hypothetical protein